ncbi:MAG: 4'-phosphopantetheinyl transferase family protein, partial [bacterium]
SWPPSLSVLGTASVHVWSATLDIGAIAVQAFEQTLAPDERERALRFHFARDRDRFIAGRGLLRAMLGSYLDVRPADIRFDYNPQGKPALGGKWGQSDLCFNLAHSNGQALCAVTRARRVGIDLERLDVGLAEAGIAERFFAPGEIRALHKLPAEAWVGGFFACWTRKEAYVKARGEGLTLPLRRFEVSVLPGERSITLQSDDDPRLSADWSITELSSGPHYAAALAVEGRADWRLECWQWPVPRLV